MSEIQHFQRRHPGLGRAGCLLVALAVLWTSACDSQRARKPPSSAIWLGSNAPLLEASHLSRLRAAGVDELFLQAAELSSSGSLAQRFELPRLPPGTTATLVLTGALDPLAVDVESLAADLRQLRFEAEGEGIVPLGFHFDLLEVGSRSAYAEMFGELRPKLGGSSYLSASAPRQWVGSVGYAELSKATDFLVVFLYGQRVHELEDLAAWDQTEIERQLQQIEALAQPYLLGLVTLGTATHLTSGGQVRARTTRISLPEVLWNRALKLQPGFTLAAGSRRVYEVGALRRATVGPFELKSGDRVRVVRPASADLEELGRLLGAWHTPNCLGRLYYRLAGDEERLSLSLGNLLNALDPNPATPDLELQAAVQRRIGGGYRMRFAIRNRNGEITDLSLLDNNYLQVTVKNGTVIGHRVDVGDFYRFDLLRHDSDGELERTFRNPDVIRLHLAILGGDQRVETGDLELRTRGVPELELRAVFLLSDGRNLEVGPTHWRGSEQVGGGG